MKKFFSILLAICLFVGLLTGCSGGGEAKHEIPDAPPCYVQLEKNGQSYEVYAVQGQVWLLFNPSVSPQQAERILAENNARILDQQPEVGYYIVEVRAGKEGAFVATMRQKQEVYYVYPNAIYEPLSLTVPCVIDYFYDNDHGKMVTEMIEEASLMKVEKCNSCDVSIRLLDLWKTSDYYKTVALNQLLNLSYNTKPNNQSVVINISLGTNIKKDWDDPDITDKTKQAYITGCVDDIVGQIKYLYSFYNPNIQTKFNCIDDFVVTKAAGNAGMKNKEIIFDSIQNELSLEEWTFFKKHYIFVSAKDNYRHADYPDDVYNGYGYHELLSKVDISDKTNQRKVNWHGTSFAAPRLAGYIVRAANEYNLKATEVLPFVRRATRNAFGHVVDYEMIEAEIKDFYGIYQQSPTNANTVCGHTTSTLPASLVGTKWHFTGGSSAFSYDRTFEFISTSQIRFSEVTKDLFFGGTETKEEILDYYYDSSIDRIVLMSTNCFGDTMYMHMMYDGNAMYYSIPGMAGRNEFFSEKYQRCN